MTVPDACQAALASPRLAARVADRGSHPSTTAQDRHPGQPGRRCRRADHVRRRPARAETAARAGPPGSCRAIPAGRGLLVAPRGTPVRTGWPHHRPELRSSRSRTARLGHLRETAEAHDDAALGRVRSAAPVDRVCESAPGLRRPPGADSVSLHTGSESVTVRWG
jgi:hypothetical protein